MKTVVTSYDKLGNQMVTTNIPEEYQHSASMDWSDYGYIIASKYRLKIVMALLIHPKTPKQLAIETQIGITHVSRALQELVKRGLVICINPEDLKGKVYDLTDKGRQVAQQIHKEPHI